MLARTDKPLDGLHYNELTVETTENLKVSHILEMTLKAGRHCMLVGPTGTGKSIIIQKFLRDMDKNSFMQVNVMFSAQTTANQTQQIITKKLQKWNRKLFAPPKGKKAIVFVDDLNMPKVVNGA